MMMLIDPFRFGPTEPVTLDYIDGYTTTSSMGTTSIFSGVDFGDEAPFRTIAVAVHWSADSAPSTISSATIAGVSATVHIAGDVAGPGFSDNYINCAILSAKVPTGTSGEVQVTFSAASAARIYVYRITNLLHDAAQDTDAVPGGAKPIAVEVDVQDGGALIAAHASLSTTDPVTWTGATSQYSTAGIYHGASLLVTATEADHAVEASWSGGSPVGFETLIAASFR